MRANSPRPASNGMVTASNGTAAKMVRKRPAKPALPAPELEPFAAVEVPLMDAPMLPVHAVVWLQPDLRPGLPVSSGLRIERHLNIPTPDFLPIDILPNSIQHELDAAGEPLPPDVRQQPPQSGLAPLGWDPRAVFVSSNGKQHEKGVDE